MIQGRCITPSELARFIPDLGREVCLDGLLRPVTIYRDSYGIPHARAQTPEDAFFAQGYFHAQDRMWQMEYDRRRGRGRWAEVIGRSGLSSDIFMRRLGVRERAQKDLEILSSPTRSMLRAYASGVNAFLATTERLPVEFHLMEITPQPWLPEDCLIVFSARHVMMGSFEQKLFYARLLRAVGPEKAARLFPTYAQGDLLMIPPGAAYESSPEEDAGDWFRRGLEALDWLDREEAGSNSWAVAGSRTSSGKPLLAGDPHRSLDTPNVYYQNHIACPEFDVVGLSFPGVPGFPHFGHNSRVAWCITHTGADCQDAFVEEFVMSEEEDQLCYRHDGQTSRARVTGESIPVRGYSPVRITVVSTHRGPVVVGDPFDGWGLTLRYTAVCDPNPTFNCIIPMMQAGSTEDMREAVREWVDPCNNLVSADIRGSISLRIRGRLPVRSRANAWTPVSGITSAHDWEGYVPFEEMPECTDPEVGYLVTANNRIADDTYPHYIALSFAPGYRARRISHHLAGRYDLKAEDMLKIHRDAVSLPALELVSHLLKIQSTGAIARAQERLAAWDGTMSRDLIEPTIYCAVRDALTELVLGYAMSAPGGVRDLMSRHKDLRILTRMRSPLLQMIEVDDTTLLPQGTGWKQVLAQALDLGIGRLERTLGSSMPDWTWGRVHHTNHQHLLSASMPEVSDLLNPPSVPLDGDSDVVHSASYAQGSGGFRVSGSATARYVFDLGDWEASSWITPLGVSGHPGSPHYADQMPLWAQGLTVPMLYSWDSVRQQAQISQRLLPASQGKSEG